MSEWTAKELAWKRWKEADKLRRKLEKCTGRQIIPFARPVVKQEVGWGGLFGQPRYEYNAVELKEIAKLHSKLARCKRKQELKKAKKKAKKKKAKKKMKKALKRLREELEKEFQQKTTGGSGDDEQSTPLAGHVSRGSYPYHS